MNIFSPKIIAALFILSAVQSCKQTPSETTVNNYYSVSDSLRDPSVMPRVVFTNPANGAVGPLDNFDPTQYSSSSRIVIQLNKLVNIMDLNDSTITLQADGINIPLVFSDYYYTSGVGYQYRESSLRNFLIYNVQTKYIASKTYTLTVDTTLIDIHGNRLNSPYTVSFVPEPQFRVYYAAPSGNDIEVQNYYPNQYYNKIMVRFNSKINSTMAAMLNISPPVSGSWVSNYSGSYPQDSMTVTFIPNEPFSYNTEYTVSVSPDAKDAAGSAIRSGYQFSFTTAPFTVQLNSYSSGTGPGGFSIINNLGFQFNGSVDTSTVRAAVSVSPNISYTLSYYTTNSIFQYNGININFNSQQFVRNTTYTISVKPSVRSTSGSFLLNQYDYSFTTGL